MCLKLFSCISLVPILIQMRVAEPEGSTMDCMQINAVTKSTVDPGQGQGQSQTNLGLMGSALVIPGCRIHPVVRWLIRVHVAGLVEVAWRLAKSSPPNLFTFAAAKCLLHEEVLGDAKGTMPIWAEIHSFPTTPKVRVGTRVALLGEDDASGLRGSNVLRAKLCTWCSDAAGGDHCEGSNCCNHR